MKPKFNVLLHKQGSLLSLEDDSDLSLRQGQKLIYSIQQEVLNKTEVADFFDCDPKLDDLEDDDLEVCLVKKFDERALCRSKHLEFLVAKHGLGDQLTFQRDCERFRDEAKNEEYVEIIRDIIDGFTADRAHGNHSARCGIKPPCVARIFRLRLVERFREQRPEKSTFLVRKLNSVLLKHSSFVSIFSLKTWSKSTPISLPNHLEGSLPTLAATWVSFSASALTPWWRSFKAGLPRGKSSVKKRKRKRGRT